MKLYELNAAIENFEFEIDPDTGEYLNIDEYRQLEVDWDTKAENTACIIKQMKADIDAINAEIKNLQDRKKKTTVQFKSLENYLKEEMNKRNQKNLRSGRVEVRFSHTKATVVNDEEKVIQFARAKGMNDLYTEKTTFTVNKTNIKKHILNGEIVDGAEVVENQNVIIK